MTPNSTENRRERPQKNPARGPLGIKSVRIGTFANIEVGFDYSWLFIFALVSLSLSKKFSMEHADWSQVLAWTTGVSTSLVFFLCILLHEFGHGIVSNHLGLPVRSVTLFVFGGLAKLSAKPRRPRDQFLIGIAGPIVSVVLGGLFLGAARLIPDSQLPGEILVAACAWLGFINIAMAIFNLVPGHPLDGGHLLRAIVWAASGSERLGTRVASATGSAFASFLIALGAFTMLLTHSLNGFWFVLIGWFLRSASRATLLHEVLEEQLGAIRTGDVVESDFPRVEFGLSVEDLISGAILKKGERHFCVMRNDDFLGLITLNEVKSVPSNERSSTSVQEIMLSREHLEEIDRSTSLWDAMVKMDDLNINQLPVIESGRLRGLLTREQLLRVMRNQKTMGTST